MASAAVPADTIRDLKSKYGDDLSKHTLRFDDHEWVVVTRPVTPGEWKRFKEQSLDNAKRAAAVENLARTALVWASGSTSIERKDVVDAFDAILSVKPGVSETVGGKVAELAGLNAESEVGKL